MGEAKDYLMRAAAEDRTRREAEEHERRAEQRMDVRRERDKIFEASKHMTTLSTTALVLLFTAGKFGLVEFNVLPGIVLFGTSLVAAVIAMGACTQPEGRTGTDAARIELFTSMGIFLIGVLFVVVWPAVAAQTSGG